MIFKRDQFLPRIIFDIDGFYKLEVTEDWMGHLICASEPSYFQNLYFPDSLFHKKFVVSLF